MSAFIDGRFMIVDLYDLVIAAVRVGMDVPEYPDSPKNFNSVEYPHFAVFVNLQLHNLHPIDQHFSLEDNAKIIASLSDEQIYETSISDLKELGCV